MKLYFIAFLGDDKDSPSICHDPKNQTRYIYHTLDNALFMVEKYNRISKYKYTVIAIDVQVNEEFDIESLDTRR